MGGSLLGMAGAWAADYGEASDPYTSKIGGVPDWPIPVNSDLIRCGACATPLCLLAQVYAPLSHHRTLFVLACLSTQCPATSFRVLRLQTTAPVDAAQPSSPPVSLLSDDEDQSHLDFQHLGKALLQAATLASNTKPKKKPRKKRLSSPPTPLQHHVPVLPCFYIYAQEETSREDLSSLGFSSLSIQGNATHVEDPSHAEETWENEHYEYDKALTADRTYLKFMKRLDANPEQCFRYSYGGRPILAAADEIDPGSCRLCGRQRQFEMQLMPPLLYFLQEGLGDQRHLVEKWDWMTLIVYTCPQSCCAEIEQRKSNNKGWIVAEEAIVAQCEEPMPVQLGVEKIIA
ncbi:hypothetical protein Fmac_007373 [Flemingia macrophylla]|uniref:Programmed cell death protein 2 C-terminal domain-containing protein n=1 Tax=Flemingia macrophylla TaxID=520843 RepID=A0ABD1MUC7_9FABA